MLTKEVARIKTELLRRLAHARIDLDHAFATKGEDSVEFLWKKCRVETLEGVLHIVDPTQEYAE